MQCLSYKHVQYLTAPPPQQHPHTADTNPCLSPSATASTADTSPLSPYVQRRYPRNLLRHQQQTSPLPTIRLSRSSIRLLPPWQHPSTRRNLPSSIRSLQIDPLV